MHTLFKEKDYSAKVHIIKYMRFEKMGHMGLFDGACPRENTHCRLWGILFLSNYHLIDFKSKYGRWTNNREEILALRTLIKLSLEEEVDDLLV